MPDYERLYLDADVYLGLIKGEADRVDIARSLLRDGQDRRFRVVASTLLYAEVCGHGDVRAASDQAAVDQKVSAFFEYGFIEWVEVDLVVAREARRLSRVHRLRGADAIHLASAIRARCDVLMTWNKNDFPIGQTVEGVEVREPFLFGQSTIDDELPGGGGSE
ncbi:MAG TPA: type II toxin-antitoxin system VapC family toxin [Mycobacteriales bacterium]|nr:type II toxin-antitoxin system VapC family toxin [Mycobacteriales bacterium]